MAVWNRALLLAGQVSLGDDRGNRLPLGYLVVGLIYQGGLVALLLKPSV